MQITDKRNSHFVGALPPFRRVYATLSLILMWLLLGVAVLLADTPQLALPIDCEIGESCYIQHLVDREPGAEVTDFNCGPLSYDGHKGTDFALPDLRTMERGVNVLAPLSGRVISARDAMPNRVATGLDDPQVQGRECGNGVVIKHSNGWETQYCHLDPGSVLVSVGDRVVTGDILGQVGLSGLTQFPHLHFSVRHDDAVVDPFDTADNTHCEGTKTPSGHMNPR